MQYGFGVDLGGTSVKLACFHSQGEMLHKWEIPTRTQEQGKYILPDIAASILAFIKEKNVDNIIGVGIGVPGPVNSEGVVNRCVNLGWGVFPVAQELSRLTGLPAAAGNDANMAALGESWMGSGQGCRNMLFTTLGTGVGGGIISDGRVLCGAHGSAGEIGHIVLEPEEQDRSTSGQSGTVEQYCSATGIVRLARQALTQSTLDSILRHIPEITCKDVFDAAKAGDGLAEAVLSHVYRYMGHYLASVACVVNPEVIVIGGGVSRAGEMLIDGLKPWFDKYVFHAASHVAFRLASLGNDAGAYGAFKLILDETTTKNGKNS